jgi:hypothetical protein
MFWAHNHPISTLRSMIRSRILIGPLCLLFLVLLIRAGTQRCFAPETEKAHGQYVHIVPVTNWNHAPKPHIPSENGCACSFSVDSCCMDATSNTPKNFHVFLTHGDNPRRSSTLQAAMIRPFESTPLRHRDSHFRDSNSFDHKESFLVNCTFLI